MGNNLAQIVEIRLPNYENNQQGALFRLIYYSKSANVTYLDNEWQEYVEGC